MVPDDEWVHVFGGWLRAAAVLTDDQRMAASVVAFYGDESPPLPVGVIPGDAE